MFLIKNDEDMKRVCGQDKVVVYGAGLVAHVIVKYLLENFYGERVLCIAVKSRENNPAEILGIPVLQMDEVLKRYINTVFIIATLENLHLEIVKELESSHCKEITAVSDFFYRSIRRKDIDFNSDILCRQIHMFREVQTYHHELSDRLQRIEQELLYNREMGEVRQVNYQTFSEFEGIHKGRDIVIVATGPSLQKYKPISNAVHIGVNTAYKASDIVFDYYFLQDYTGKSIQTVEDIKAKPFVKFFGKFMECSEFHQYSESTMEIPEQKALQSGARRYYTDWPPESTVHRDIRYAPLMEYHSVTFPAIQFALFCNPKRIYLAGCDCSQEGHFNQDKQDVLEVGCVLRGYAAIKEFAGKHYPETEIISINPVGLKGIFKDIYTE